jgi:hypothetical protein
MKRPPTPLVMSGLAPDCPDVLGATLLLTCVPGWGWSREHRGVTTHGEVSHSLQTSVLFVVPETYVAFTTPRSGLCGCIARGPDGVPWKRFLAFTMSDGCNFNFTDRCAPAWRVMLGAGVPDHESHWFPVLKGEDVYFGYGSIMELPAALSKME